METIGGGTVKYKRITAVPCPDTPTALGACVRDGVLEVWSRGRLTETIAVAAGDLLLVADHATVEPGTALLQSEPWQRVLRAELPADVEATAAWGAPVLTGAPDEALRFAPGARTIRLELRDREGRVLVTHELDRAATPMVATGATVRRGDRLASIPGCGRIDRIGGIAELVAFLEARTLERGRAVIAPCDGTITALDPTMATLRARDGRILQLRLRRGHHVAVRVGDDVLAGDMILFGERSHHALLHAWGEARLAAHMIGELEIEAARRGLAVPRVYWALAVRAMLDWRRVRDPGDTALRSGEVVSRDALARAQREAQARGGRPAVATPVLRGLGRAHRRASR
jgi:DNA-directed RNA polymerase subunit beta'